jgi:hypothetical protein
LWAAGREQAGQKKTGNCSFHIPEYHISPLSANLTKLQPKPLQTRIAQAPSFALSPLQTFCQYYIQLHIAQPCRQDLPALASP